VTYKWCGSGPKGGLPVTKAEETMFTLLYNRDTLRAATRAWGHNHSRAVSRGLSTNHSRAVSRAFTSNHSRAVAAAGRA
jgi:hypothetical protein